MKIPFSRIFSQRKPLMLALVALLLFSGFYAFVLRQPPKVEVNYVEVGQADSILLTSSEGKVVLIDGGYPDARIMPYLAKRNIQHIDLVVATHGHDDHIGGLVNVLQSIPVDQIATSEQVLDTPVFQDFEQAIQSSRAKHVIVHSGDKLPFGSLTFQVLSPRKINPASVNNNSVVLRLEVGKVVFLFTGDTQKLEETRLVNTGAKLRANILKIPHHAADTSSSPAFLEKIQPEVAIYFAEIGNMHYFPHQVTLDNLYALGTKVYGTDVNGTITVTTDGRTYSLQTEREGQPHAPERKP